MTAKPDPQLRLDFCRGEQLAILRDAVLPPGKGRDGIGVTPVVLKAVLRAIDDHGRGRACWATQKTLASEACIGFRQVRRAVEALRTLGVLIVQRRRVHAGAFVSVNFHTIVWGELALLARPKREQTKWPFQQTKWPFQQTKWPFQQTKWPSKAISRTAPKRFEPPPPTPSDPTVDGGTDWAAAEDCLKEAGVEFWERLAAEARAKGISPDQVLEIVRTYKANRLKLKGPGAVVIRIRDGAWPVKGIVSPEQIAERADVKRQQLVAQEREEEMARLRKDAKEEEFRGLELEYGHRLDSLTADELRELTKRGFQGQAAAVLIRCLRQPHKPWNRLALLRQFAKESGVEGTPAGEASDV